MKMEEEKLVLEKSWDKVFPKSDKVNHKKGRKRTYQFVILKKICTFVVQITPLS